MRISVRARLIAVLAVLLVFGVGGVVYFFAAGRGITPWRNEAKTDQDAVSGLPVDFIRERISLDIEPAYITVAGIYWFRCNSPLGEHFRIRYPFPVDEQHPFPDSVAVFQAGGTPIPFEENRAATAVEFTANLLAHPEFTVVYRQRITAPDARYILTTTSAWQKPLERAQYIVSMPTDLTPDSLSLKPDESRVINGRRVYTFTRNNFLPDRDLTVSWKPREKRVP